MVELKKRLHDAQNGLDYALVGDYYLPDLVFDESADPIGRWGRMHGRYLKDAETACAALGTALANA